MIQGRVTFHVLDRWGKARFGGGGGNLITALGKIRIAELIRDNTGARPAFWGLGDDGSASAESQTALQGSEHTRIAIAAPSSLDNEITYAVVILNSSGSTWDVQEMGLFDLVSAGLMFARFVPLSFNLFDQETVTASWILRIS